MSQEFKFDESFERLEKIMGIMENERPGFDEMIALYNEAMEIIKKCGEKLEGIKSELGIEKPEA